MTSKAALRTVLRNDRKAHVADIPDTVQALLFKQPPAPLQALIPDGSIIGLYHARADEAPAHHYAKYFTEAGHTIALPTFPASTSAMAFAKHTDPFGESDLEEGPFGIMQPLACADDITPTVVFAPLIGFTSGGARLGHGGGHYDRWLTAHRTTIAIGMGWDSQLVDTLPTEPHDQPMTAVVTPTRLYGPF